MNSVTIFLYLKFGSIEMRKIKNEIGTYAHIHERKYFLHSNLT